jgi:hypothetical protein
MIGVEAALRERLTIRKGTFIGVVEIGVVEER